MAHQVLHPRAGCQPVMQRYPDPAVLRDSTTVSRPTPFLRVQLVVKRLLDVTLASLLVLLLAPLLATVAVCVRFSSKGPIFFKQERCGRHGDKFICLKFRTMFVEQHNFVDPDLLSQRAAAGLLHKPKNDPRITRTGTLLRKGSIDELPQLFNVLRGDMSLVGPRPLVPHMLKPYPELRAIRSQFRPGITCLWQIRAREQNTSALLMMPHDLEYISKFSLWLDFKILLLTPAAVLSTRGAH